MTEREKMLAGKLIYDPFAEGMPEERTKAHRLCKLYNDTFDTETDKRKEILDELMPNRGENVYLQGPIYFDFGTNISMGKDSYANFNFTVLDRCRRYDLRWRNCRGGKCNRSRFGCDEGYSAEQSCSRKSLPRDS